jgi:uncharacterized protein (DUF1778 family)
LGKGALAFLVHVEPETDRTVRINITAREKQIEQIDKLADHDGLTRSAFMVQSSLMRSRELREQGAVAARPLKKRRRAEVHPPRRLRSRA